MIVDAQVINTLKIELSSDDLIKLINDQDVKQEFNVKDSNHNYLHITCEDSYSARRKYDSARGTNCS